MFVGAFFGEKRINLTNLKCIAFLVCLLLGESNTAVGVQMSLARMVCWASDKGADAGSIFLFGKQKNKD